MQTILPYMLVCVLALGCASTLPQQTPGEPILAPPIPAPKKNTATYETTAWDLFLQTDYVRALRLAYLANNTNPQEPSSAFLVGLIYDQGFNRPDLAFLAYNNILQQAAHYRGVNRLQPRLPYLFRRTQERVAKISLHNPQASPLQGTPLALFPILPWAPNKGDAAFALGLTDVLFAGLIDSDAQLTSLRTHLLAHAFLAASPQANAQSFAKWVGAEKTLSGMMTHSHNHQITIVLTLTDAQGQTLGKSAPIIGNMTELDDLQNAVFHELSQNFDLPVPPHHPMPSSLALTLHGQALDAYLTGDVEQALTFFEGALNLAPQSNRIHRLNKWVETDFKGSQIDTDLVGLYRLLKYQPDPNDAAIRRILATQNLLVPTNSLDSGKEPLTPFKPPHSEATP